MKAILPEWYEPDHNVVVAILRTGTIALDANAMLDLYRMGRDQRDQILKVLHDNRDRLFVPFQVALEFQRNRLIVVADMDAIYKQVVDHNAVSVDPKKLEQIRDKDVRDDIKKLVSDIRETLDEGLQKLRDEHALGFSDARRDDPVRKALDELLPDTALGERPTQEQLEERRATALRRYQTRTPPATGIRVISTTPPATI